VKGLALIQAPPFSDFRYGDRIKAKGKLETPINSGEFDYREYLARQDVYSTPHPVSAAFYSEFVKRHFA
jgi:hypothetical protein